MSLFKNLIKRFIEVEESPTVPDIKVATSRDHSDVHYLYKLRKALVLLVGNSSMKGFSASQVEELHTKIVAAMIENNQSHWYDDWDSDLDETLPEDLKLASSGYEPKKGQSIFDLEEEELKYRKCLEDEEAICLWKAPAKRSKIPKDHFLDQKNRKYPYKNSDGSVNCGGLMAAYKYAKGARGASPNSKIAAKAKRLMKENGCNKTKKAEAVRIGKVGKIPR